MLHVLLESRAQRARQRGGAVLSVVVHTGLIAFGLAATGGGVSPLAPKPPEKVIPLYPPVPQAARASTAAPRRGESTSDVAMPPPPSVIFEDLPPVPICNLGDPPLPIEWGHSRPIDGPDFRRVGLGGAATVDGIPFEGGVDNPAIALAGNPPPRYPDVLRRAGIEGQVTIQVVVDTTGRADMATLKIVSADHALFAEAVVAVLPRYRFLPAASADTKVKMWVIVPFVFEMRQ